MSIPTRLIQYLDQQGAQYDVLAHRHSRCSAETARSAHIPPHRLAKSVMLEDESGRVLAVLPADRRLQLGRLAHLLGRERLHLSDESSLSPLLTGCEPGAVPALGMAWGIETVLDAELDHAGPVVYMEAGDHERLIRMSTEQFRLLMSPARRGSFAEPLLH